MDAGSKTASDGAADDRFGVSVSISGDYAVVGALFDDDNGDKSGSAYIFKRTGTNWVQEAKLLASDGAAGDELGISVSISGDYAVVGALLDDENETDVGSAYVFKRIGTSWTQEAKLLASDGAADDHFGFSVSISGECAVVGAVLDDDNGNASGSVYVFKRTGTSWEQEARLLASDVAAGDVFGYSLSISGDYAVVGAYGDDDNGTDAGSAYLFKRTDTSWIEEAKLLPPDGGVIDWFGSSVSISGDYVIVGAQFDDENGISSGSAYLFKRTGTTWAQEAKLLASDGAADDIFGYSISISGDYAVVGAQWDDDNGSFSGSAYVYSGIIVGIDEERAGIPKEYTLSQNYPNPFNPETVIEYALANQSEVKLIIYNLRGEQVALLIDGTVPAGNHRVSWDASKVSSGIYFYRLKTDNFVQTRKMLLLK